MVATLGSTVCLWCVLLYSNFSFYSYIQSVWHQLVKQRQVFCLFHLDITGSRIPDTSQKAIEKALWPTILSFQDRKH